MLYMFIYVAGNLYYIFIYIIFVRQETVTVSRAGGCNECQLRHSRGGQGSGCQSVSHLNISRLRNCPEGHKHHKISRKA